LTLATIRTICHSDPLTDVEFALRVRHRMLKLRWIGCESEAAAVAERLKHLHLDACDFSLAILEAA